jgi:DNA (cytosine-5)-methyltransferase 1
MTKPYAVLDLFAGIGGFSLGLERTGGFKTVAMCEIDKKCHRVLQKHWPHVHIYTDVKELTVERLQADGNVPDVIVGGFPCQDISNAGRGVGIGGERSGLWSEMFRLIRDVRPTWAIIENVSALRNKGLTLVLQNLGEIGYCVEWHCIPAYAVGAPHQRDRIWIIAYRNPYSESEPTVAKHDEMGGVQKHEGNDVAHPNPYSCQEGQPRRAAGEIPPEGHGLRGGSGEGEARQEPGRCREDVAHPHSPRLEGWLRSILQECSSKLPSGQGGTRKGGLSDHWQTEPCVGRVADGVPRRVDRLKQLGNSVVPQVIELLGRAIIEADRELSHAG